MKTSKFIRFLSHLNKKEVRRFDKFLQSDYHDTEPKTHELWAYILRLYPNLEADKLEKTDASVAVYGDDQHTTHITNRLAELSRVIQDFLILEQLNSNDVGRAMQMLEVLKGRDMSHLSLLQIGKAERLLDKQAQRNMTHYYRKFRLAHERYFHAEVPTIKANSYELLKNVMKYLDEFYTLGKLRHICEIRNRERVYNEDFDLIQSDLDFLLEEATDMDSPLSNIYIDLLDLIRAPDNMTYMKLKKQVFKYIKVGNKREQESLLTFLINHQSTRLRNGHSDALEEVFELMNFGLENYVFMEGQYWSVPHFINAINTACQIGKTDWASQFIGQNSNKLPDKMSTGISARKKILYLCKGYVNLAKGEYQAAVRHAYLARPAGVAVNLRSWTLQIQALYELRHEEIDSYEAIDSFANFLYNNKKQLGSNTICANERFIRMVKKLLRADYTAKYNKSYFREQLEWETKPIVCKLWLEKKIEALKE